MSQSMTGAYASQTATKHAGPVPCLTFKEECEEPVRFYVSLIKDSKVKTLIRSDGRGPIPEGQLMHASFVLDGRDFVAFDGGPSFSFSEAISMMVTCETQEEIDDLWARLTEGGGEPGPCGWLKDRFGVSWQVVPAALGEMMSNPSGGDSAKVMDALLKMGKLDIAELKRAYRGGS